MALLLSYIVYEPPHYPILRPRSFSQENLYILDFPRKPDQVHYSPIIPVLRRGSVVATEAMAEAGSVQKTEEEWQAILSPEQFRILRQKGTELRGTGEYDKFFADGIYNCAGCGTPLYKSSTKFNSGCGWPAFYEGLPGAINRSVSSCLYFIIVHHSYNLLLLLLLFFEFICILSLCYFVDWYLINQKVAKFSARSRWEEN
ncbi:hypothetical protein L1049_016143 [Liquidambar formosana]|uniref:MsrB domain-containing protein n=1 Tax=Liquidambar formosana TaxID=63359 RepID=A0AAP0S556_LIQFO